jgi:hypothetical protein
MAAPANPIQWFRGHPFVADSLLAAIATSLTFVSLGNPAGVDYRSQNVLGIGLVLLASVPVAWRRRAPVPDFFLTVLAITFYEGLGYPSSNALGSLPPASWSAAARP